MKRIAAMCVLLVVVMSAGCSVRFPYGRSLDRHNFLSTHHQPISLTLTDTVTGETVWTLDVPVDKMAVVDFEHDTDWVPGQSPALPAEKIYWDVFNPGAVLGALRHEQDLSGRPVLLNVIVRKADTDAMAPNMAAGPMPAARASKPAMIGAPATSSEPVTPTRPMTAPASTPPPAPAGVPDADAPAAIPSGPAVDRPDQRQ